MAECACVGLRYLGGYRSSLLCRLDMPALRGPCSFVSLQGIGRGCGVYLINRDCQCARWCIAFIRINEIGFSYYVEIPREVREPCDVLLTPHVWENKTLHEIVGHEDRNSVRYKLTTSEIRNSSLSYSTSSPGFDLACSTGGRGRVYR